MNKTKCFLILSSLMFFLTYGLLAQTSSLAEGCSPLEVEFFAPTGSSTYFWDFQDGATSTLQNPINTFTTPGTYQVQFSESVGGPIIGTSNITVFPSPILDISATPMGGCAPLDVDFQSTSIIDPGITVNNYSWVFGDGGTANNNASPSHTYTTEGAFTVSLNIETNFPSCNATEIFPAAVAVSSIPGLGFITSPNPPNSCTAPFEVSFINTTPNPQSLTFDWDFGNGTTFTGTTPAAQTFETEGTYSVVLTATDALGCSGSFTQIVSVGAPLASFVIPDTVCVNTFVNMQNASATGSYFWNFGPNADPQTSTFVNPQDVVFTTAGFHDISLTVTSGACSGDTTITIYADLPDASYTASPIYACAEPLTVAFDPISTIAVDWAWEFSDGEVASEENPIHEFFNEDETIYSINGELLFYTELTVTNPSGCTASFLDSVILNEPNALFMPDVINGCAPLAVTFSDSSSSNETLVLWEWDYGDGQTATFSNDNPHQHVFADPGEYNVQLIVTNTLGCTDTSYLLVIEVGDQITPDFQVDLTEVCPGDSVHFTNLTPVDNIDAFHFATDNGRSFHCFTEPDLTWAFVQETGPMDVTLTVEYNGCYSSLTQSDLITVKGPIAQFDYLVDCANPFDISFTNQSMDASNITWDFGDNSTSTTSALVHTFDSTGVYWVTLSAENNTSGCPVSVDSMQIFVKDVQAIFELDTILCAGMNTIDASPSIDVEASCWKGYDWYTSFNRPIATQDASLPLSFPPGDQDLTLVVTDINGCTDTTSLAVEVFSSNPSFTFDDDRICIPAGVSFTDFSTADTTIVSWDWDFGDGNSATDQNPTHNYTTPSPGQITVTLTTTDAVGCPGVATETISVYEPVSIIAAVPFPNLCVGEEIEFTASDFTQEGSNLTFDWNLGNGATDTGNMASTSYDAGGSYNVLLNIEEVATGCQNTSVVNVEVQDFPEAVFTSNLDGMGIICYPQNALFSDNSNSNNPLTYDWDFGNGQFANTASPGASFGKGIFEVDLIVSTPFGCSDTTSNTYTFIGPEGNFIMDPNTICKGETISFTLIDTVDITSFSWDFGDGTVVDNINPTSHQYNFNPPSGQTVATLILRGADDACTIPIEQTIFIHEVIADFTINDGIDTTICANESLSFTNNSTGADVYTWNFRNGNTSNTENPSNVFTESGNLDISLTVVNNNLGCTDEIIKSIVVNALPNTAAIGDSICANTIASLSVTNPSDNSTYTWFPEAPFNGNNNLPNPTINGLLNTTTFTVEELDVNGCSNSSNVLVAVVPLLPTLSLDTSVCKGSDLLLPYLESEFYTFAWNPEIINCEECLPSQLENLQENSSYTLTAMDVFGLECGNVSQFDITVTSEPVAIPNAFTPNGDRNNDHFNFLVISEDLIFSEIVEEFKVWNRWGELVYDNDTPATGWNGQQKGRPAASDVYIYRVKLVIEGCQEIELEGDVTLIR